MYLYNRLHNKFRPINLSHCDEQHDRSNNQISVPNWNFKIVHGENEIENPYTQCVTHLPHSEAAYTYNLISNLEWDNENHHVRLDWRPCVPNQKLVIDHRQNRSLDPSHVLVCPTSRGQCAVHFRLMPGRFLGCLNLAGQLFGRAQKGSNQTHP